MATAPYGVRLLVGAATVAVEETLRLPKTILMYPMTLASQTAHVVMRLQQSLADLVIKGDSTLDLIFAPKDEQPEWATFDEDLDDTIEGSAESPGGNNGRTQGRFALYSLADAADADGAPANQFSGPTVDLTVPVPEVAKELDFATLTLAQLRARLHTLTVDELEELLAYEQATKARAPFQTLLANGITRANAK